MVRKGFTLIELLIVIGIIAILAAAVVLTLNPAELLRQSRDSTRISDLATLKSALALYLADVTSPNLGNNLNCYVHDGLATENCAPRFGAVPIGATTVIDPDRLVDSNGWIPVNFESISSGSPLPNLPVDPVNDLTYFYAYRPGNTATTPGACSGSGSGGCTVYELSADLESTKFANDTIDTDSVEENDGGNNVDLYEVGTRAALNL